MIEYSIEHGIRIGKNITAMLKGVFPVHIGDILSYPNGKEVSVVGIGSGRVIDDVIDVLLSGDYDTSQDRVYST